MKIFTLLAGIAIAAACVAQEDLNLLSSSEISTKIKELQNQGKDTWDKQLELVWTLAKRSATGDKSANNAARKHAERLKDENSESYRAKFIFGFTRTQEAFQTADPFLRKRRVDEGRRAMTSAIPTGNKDAAFLLDAGVLLSSLDATIDMHATALNILTISRRLYNGKFLELAPEARSEWHGAMAACFNKSGLEELARDQYRFAYELAPTSDSGRKALLWLRGNGGVGDIGDGN